MMIGLTGATGFIGRRVIALARARGHEVIAFTRNADRPVTGCVETRRFTLDETPDVSRCDAVIHLSGENVFGIWTKEKRRRIRDSREIGTRRIVDAILSAEKKPRVLVSGSAIGFYGDTGERITDEESPLGAGFLTEVAEAWEREATRVREAGVRVVLLRTAVVLGAGGGALGAMLPIFRAGLGGTLGSGRQWMSWIHIDDAAGLALHAVETETLDDPMNVAAPEPCRNTGFTRTLAGALHRPAIFKMPAFALRMLTGEFSRELLDSKRVIPQRALESGYVFRFPNLNGALREAIGQK